jgi:hypothetical protein
VLRNVSQRLPLEGLLLLTCSVLPQYPLPPLHEPFLVPHHAPDLENVARHPVLENLNGLRRWYGPRQELDEVSRVQNRRRIECL